MSALNRQITLLPLWGDNASGWFTHLEAQFPDKNIFEEWDRLDFVRPQQGGDPTAF
jgi:hypothetical protein